MLVATTLILYAASFSTVILAAHVPGYENFLQEMTRENGFFEWASVLLLLLIAGYGAWSSIRDTGIRPRWMRIGVLLFALLALVAALEEVSWGQQLFHFESGSYFEKHNYQQETNLHNLMPSELFSSLVYSSVYVFFVFLPLGLRLLSKAFALPALLLKGLPHMHVTLIVLYGAAFQAYFYDDLGAWADLAALLCGLALFALVLAFCRELRTPAVAVHYLFVVAAVVIFMLSHRIFGFYNLQYEIREMFVVMAVLYYYVHVIQLSKKAA